MNGGLGLGKGLIATEMREFIAVMKKKKRKKMFPNGIMVTITQLCKFTKSSKFLT